MNEQKEKEFRSILAEIAKKLDDLSEKHGKEMVSAAVMGLADTMVENGMASRDEQKEDTHVRYIG